MTTNLQLLNSAQFSFIPEYSEAEAHLFISIYVYDFVWFVCGMDDYVKNDLFSSVFSSYILISEFVVAAAGARLLLSKCEQTFQYDF